MDPINDLPVPDHIQPIIGGPDTVPGQTGKTMADQLLEFQKSRSTKPTQTEPEVEAAQEDVDPVVEHPSEDKIFIGDKAYTKEEIARSIQKTEQQMFQPPTPPPSLDPEEELADNIFVDPKTTLKKLKDQVKQEFRQEQYQKEAQVQTVNKFYNQYKDLQDHKDLVEFYAFKMKGDLANTPEDVALSKVAQAVRGKIASIKGSRVATEELSSKPAVTVGATGNPTARTTAQVQSKPMDFISQMQQAFKKGKTKY